MQTCFICGKVFDPSKTAYLTYSDIYNRELSAHPACWNNDPLYGIKAA